MKKRYPRIPHLPGSRTGPSDRTADLQLAHRLTVRSKPGDRILVQEKLDGSCVCIERQAGQLLAVGREGIPCLQSPSPIRQAFAVWLHQHLHRFAPLQEGERLVCEWLPVAHGTRYTLPHEPVVALDLFDALGKRLVLEQLIWRVQPMGLSLPTLLHAGAALPVSEALNLLGQLGHHGALDPAEGVVYRLESTGRVLQLAKVVRQCKTAGFYLSDHTGLPPVHNSWLERTS